MASSRSILTPDTQSSQMKEGSLTAGDEADVDIWLYCSIDEKLIQKHLVSPAFGFSPPVNFKHLISSHCICNKIIDIFKTNPANVHEMSGFIYSRSIWVMKHH